MSLTNYVNNEPTGVSEELLFRDREAMFAGWRSVQTYTTPVYGLQALGHVQNGGFWQPGDAPTLTGMALTGIPAGDPVANEIVHRNSVVSQNAGPGWNVQPPTPTVGDRARADEMAKLESAQAVQSYAPGSQQWNDLQMEYVPEDGATTLWGAAKGTSRALFTAFDTPFVNSPDTFARTIALNETRRLQGMAPLDRGDQFTMWGGGGEGSQALAIPGIAYTGAALRGDRVNTGTGFFARGDIAADVQAEIDRYDQWVQSQSKLDFDKAKLASDDGVVWVDGVLGQKVPAQTYEQWIDVLNTAGRAATVDMAIQNSPQQAALGMPYGTLADDIFQDGVYGVDRNGNYYRATTGRFLAQEVFQMDSTTFASKALSGVIDFSKHLLDLPVITGTKKTMQLLGIGGNRLVGLTGEAGNLQRATTTLQDAARWVDPDGRAGMGADIVNGTIDTDKMVNAVARGADRPLQDAIRTVDELKAAGMEGTTATGKKLNEGQVDDLIRRVENGDWAASRWAERTLGIIHSDPDAVAAQLDNLSTVVNRSDEVTIIGGRLGDSTAHIDDVVLGRIVEDVRHTDDIFRNGKAGVVLDEAGRPIVTFDADLAKAQDTLRRLDGAMRTELTSKAATAAEYLRLSDRLDTLLRQRAVQRWTTYAHVPGMRRFATDALDTAMDTPEIRALRTQLDEVTQRAKDLNLDIGSRSKLETAVNRGNESFVDTSTSALGENLFNERWITQRWAQKALGDDDEAAEAVANLTRVLKRHDAPGDLAKHASSWNPVIPESTLSQLFTGSQGAVRSFLEELAEASTHEQMWRILRRTVQHTSETAINPALIDALVGAKTVDEVADRLVRMAKGEVFVPNRVKLMGDWATRGGAVTSATQALGAGAGFVQGGLAGGEAEGKDWDWGDAFGGAIMGGLAGRYVGSAGVGLSAQVFGKGMATSRSIDDVGDMMDVLLAGSRSATANNLQILQRVNRNVNLTQQRYDQLSRPAQMGAAFGHLPFGRRLAKETPTKLNLNSPAHLYDGLRQYARNFGLRGDERITEIRRVIDEGFDEAGNKLTRTERLKVISSNFDTIDSYDAAVRAYTNNGWEVTNTVDLDGVFSKVATMQSNNTAAGWRVLNDFMRVVDTMLMDADVPDDLRRAATRFTEGGIDDFMGNVDQIGTPTNLQQMAVNGRVADLSDAPLLTSEMWAGHIAMPPPEVIARVMNHTSTLGRVTNALTGKGVFPEALRKVRATLTADPDYAKTWDEVLTPDFERNLASRFMRGATSLAFVPLVLLTRPIAFGSRVLLDDQMRMAAGGLGVWQPASPMAWIIGNYRQFRRAFAPSGSNLRAAPSSSTLPRELFDPVTGTINADLLDDLTMNDLDDLVQSHLRIADRSRAKGSSQMVFGAAEWKAIGRDHPEYIESVAREYRQLLRDPMIQRLAQSEGETVGHVTQEVADWLRQTPEGQKVLREWSEQFNTLEEARAAMEPEALRAFLADQYARMHLKTGGDWVYVDGEGVARMSDGRVFGPNHPDNKWADDFAENGAGYRIIRRGDDELVSTLRTRRLGGTHRVMDENGNWVTVEGRKVTKNVDDEVQEAIVNFVRQRNDLMERRFKSADLAAQQSGSLHRLPGKVKSVGNRGVTQTRGEFTRSLEWMYDLIMGPMSQRFSREPVFAQHYWERVGMLLPQMTDEVAEAFLTMARKENPALAEQVQRIAKTFDDAGLNSKVIDDFEFVDLNAKAYGVERLNNTLFDLYQQRNFVDSVRVIAPFMGPMVEAFENWARVLRRRPLTVWRRGLQTYNMLWDPSPIALDNSKDKSIETGWGTFYNDPETGEDMIRWPLVTPIKNWMFGEGGPFESPGVSQSPLETRLRGLNVVFGPSDFSESPRLPGFGVPTDALNPGLGPIAQMPVGKFLRDKEGFAGQVYDTLFEYGEGETILQEITPFHLQRIFEGVPALSWVIGEEGRMRTEAAANDHLGRMVATGELGEGPNATYNIHDEWDVEAAQEEAKTRAIHEAVFEGFLRALSPSVAGPDPQVQVAALTEAGVPGGERLLPFADLASEAYDLMTEEGAQTFQLDDGTKVSTEGDYEATTDYLNRKYGLDMFSAEFLNVPNTVPVHTRVYTESGLQWYQDNPEKISGDLALSGWLLMPNVALAKDEEDTDFHYPALDAAVERGDRRWVDNDIEEAKQIQARLQAREYRNIDRVADERFGTDDELSGDRQFVKDEWKKKQKEAAMSRYDRMAIPQSEVVRTREELLGWREVDWTKVGDITPEEGATIEAVLWYLSVRDEADRLAAEMGVTGIANKGDTYDQKEFMTALRADLERIVATQIALAEQQGRDMGNFVYIYNTYLAPEFDTVDDADPLQEFVEGAFGVSGQPTMGTGGS